MESLAAQLEAFRAGLLERADPNLVAILANWHRELDEAQIAGAALQAGDRAPDFTLPDRDGRLVSLRETLARGPVVLSFIRGGWCPYCTLTLRALGRRHAALRRHGAEVLALSPEAPRHNAATADCTWLPFPVLRDHDNAVARHYGLVVRLPPEVQEVYRRLGHELPAINRVPGWDLPMPAGYVVAPDGRIVFARVSSRTERRMEPADALAAVAALTMAAT